MDSDRNGHGACGAGSVAHGRSRDGCGHSRGARFDGGGWVVPRDHHGANCGGGRAESSLGGDMDMDQSDRGGLRAISTRDSGGAVVICGWPQAVCARSWHVRSSGGCSARMSGLAFNVGDPSSWLSHCVWGFGNCR